MSKHTRGPKSPGANLPANHLKLVPDLAHSGVTPPLEATPTQDTAGISVELQQLWREYKQYPSSQLRERLILHYAPLVKYVAGRIGSGLPTSVDQAELLSFGIFGLIDAIEKFDPDLATKFETYAVFRIRGAILDELRALDWLPRTLRAKANQVDQVTDELEGKLKRTPKDSEIAAALEISVAELHQIYRHASTSQLMALDDVVPFAKDDSSSSVSLADTLADDQSPDPVLLFESEETNALLHEAISSLRERERHVIMLYYFEGLTLAEVGKILQVSESRISQLHSKAVLRLRARLAELGA